MGKAQGFRGAGDIELGEHHFHPVVQIGTNETSVPALVEALESAMAAARYHSRNVMCL